MFTDFVMNGQPTGEVAMAASQFGFDPGLMRPYIDEDNQPAVTVNTGRVRQVRHEDGTLVFNKATGTPVLEPIREKQLISERIANGLPCPTTNATLLRKDQWILLDNIILTAARKRLRAWSDLRAANTYGGFDGMANPILEWERVTDTGEAMVDMDAMSEGRNFNPKFDLQGMPLPIIHSGFFMSQRFLSITRKRGTPGDTQRAELAGRRVGEQIEKMTIGLTNYDYQYGLSTDYAATSKVYGYMNHPDIITKTNMTAPDGTNGTTILNNWLTCIQLLSAQNYYGPFMVYVSDDYDQYLDNEFKTNSDRSLRERLTAIEQVQGIRRLDYLESATYPYHVLFVDMSPENVQAVNGMEITTVQWESMGGMRLNFKVMAIQVPRIRSRYIGTGTTTKVGILKATTS